jgi:hypothetical protein
LVVLVGLVDVAVRYSLPWPKCGFRALTGMPCPFCGSTRCLAAIARLQFGQAVYFNPLVVVVCVALCAWFVLWLIDCWRGQARAMELCHRIQRKPWPAILAVVLLVNWVWLMLKLPK